MKEIDKDKLIEQLLDHITKLKAIIAEQSEKIKRLEEQVAKNSKNSSKPPSSDGLSKGSPKPRSLRKKTNKQSGGQKGHKGKTLLQKSQPDSIVKHELKECLHCLGSLKNERSKTHIKRQVFDVPPPRMQVTEHQAEIKTCPNCCKKNTATFPHEVSAPVQYGHNIRAMIVYLKQYQLLPEARLKQLLMDIFGVRISTATIEQVSQIAYTNLEEFEQHTLQNILDSKLKHLDETGFRVKAKTHWLHVASDNNWTYFHVSAKRKSLLGGLTGAIVHDHWKPYFQIENVMHVLCNAHHLRELNARIDEKEHWAHQMKRWLNFALALKYYFGENGVPMKKQLRLLALYDVIVDRGLKFHNTLSPLPSYSKKRGRKARRKGHNLLLRFKNYKDDATRFITDWQIPFTNNHAEQELRMMKVQQKISGGFRSFTGAEIFARLRSFISTARKQGWDIFKSLKLSVESTFIIPA
jgi:transposase